MSVTDKVVKNFLHGRLPGVDKFAKDKKVYRCNSCGYGFGEREAVKQYSGKTKAGKKKHNIECPECGNLVWEA